MNFSTRRAMTYPAPGWESAGVYGLDGQPVGREHHWSIELIRNDRGKPLGNLANVMHAFRAAPEWQGCLAYDDLNHRVVCRTPPPFKRAEGPWIDNDDVLCAEWLQRANINVGPDTVAQAVEAIARENGFSPLQDYLRGVEWDGIERLIHMAPRYFGAEDSLLTREFFTRFMISAVARALNPGCKADHMLVLEGAQGSRKSTALAVLGGPFYGEITADLGRKEAIEQLQGKWIVEEAELATMTKSQVEEIKAFLTRTHDGMRPAYGRRFVEFKRTCVFAGTTNTDDWHNDTSGGRRFWPVKVGAEIATEALARDRDQLWAEAVELYLHGEAWHLTDAAMIAAQAQEMENRVPEDSWSRAILDEANKLGGRITTAEALNAVNVTMDKRRTTETKRVAAVLKKNGFRQCRPTNANGDRERFWTKER